MSEPSKWATDLVNNILVRSSARAEVVAAAILARDERLAEFLSHDDASVWRCF